MFSAARHQHRNCSFELPFILSQSFISSASCLSPLLPTSYQTVPGWQASRGWRGGEEEKEGGKRVRENEELEREKEVDEFPELCGAAFLCEKWASIPHTPLFIPFASWHFSCWLVREACQSHGCFNMPQVYPLNSFLTVTPTPLPLFPFHLSLQITVSPLKTQVSHTYIQYTVSRNTVYTHTHVDIYISVSHQESETNLQCIFKHSIFKAKQSLWLDFFKGTLKESQIERLKERKGLEKKKK